MLFIWFLLSISILLLQDSEAVRKKDYWSETDFIPWLVIGLNAHKHIISQLPWYALHGKSNYKVSGRTDVLGVIILIYSHIDTELGYETHFHQRFFLLEICLQFSTQIICVFQILNRNRYDRIHQKICTHSMLRSMHSSRRGEASAWIMVTQHKLG